MLTADMMRVVREHRLGFVATVTPDGSPSLSPKATFAVLDDATIAFAEIRSPTTLRNLAVNPKVEVNFVDVFARRGCRVFGTARIVARDEPAFAELLPAFDVYSGLVPRMRALVVIAVSRALDVTSPAYDDGTTEEELRIAWTAHFRSIQPSGRFLD